MLYKETVSPEMWELLQKLMQDEKLKEFILVGGTSLSLQIDHRLSVDIDLFGTKDFDTDQMLHHLEKNYNVVPNRKFKNTVLTLIDGIKVDILTHQYPILKPIVTTDNVRLISIEDIGAMKLHAIVQSGKRLKDFVDMYFLLEQYPLKNYLDGYEKKYSRNSNIAANALLYHADINMGQKIEMKKGKENNWDKMKLRLDKAVSNPNFIFGKPQNKNQQDKGQRGKGFKL